MPRDLRQAKNREVFRLVNEEIATLAHKLSVDNHAFMCECSRTGCAEQVDVPLGVYVRVRETPSAYLVRAGHEDASAEQRSSVIANT